MEDILQAEGTAVAAIQTAVLTAAAGQCILVIDDEAPVREAVTDIMALHGIEVRTAVNGQEGVDLFARYQEEIQLVLLDMSMPGINGLDTLTKLRQLNPDLPIILSSGYSQQQVAHEVKVNGRTGFLPKPYDVNTLVNKIWHFLPANLKD